MQILINYIKNKFRDHLATQVNKWGGGGGLKWTLYIIASSSDISLAQLFWGTE